ncbi:M28 family peptidase [Acidicapsa dinghuensis]|uniref:M28 family peptidase n=1 Tax=Acidicapsa dinghuensis TaxID=2218256 RepID=A0ABW1EMH9_9BACT|nr:M28 family peptidase [Acidicapsa dinghuensis]
MRSRPTCVFTLLLAALAILPYASAATKHSDAICAPCVRADLGFLASDELHGRGSGTRDEHLAALYTASLFQSFGLEPAGENSTYIQRAPLPNPFPDRLAAYLKAKGFDQNQRTDTWNTLALLRGTDAPAAPAPAADVILLTAHQDHLGLGNPVNGDSIYNGADDDASGTTAVLELARALSKGPRPKRSILFVLFGSEELGGYGNQYFLEHPPVPLTQIVANLEFEMIGRPDPALPNKTLWLTGYERSDLGPELAKHGAAISADPHPDQHFFQRSDNYALAKRGIIAQTVSSYGLHKDYHQPSDDLSHIDFDFVTNSIQSMIEPVRWLADTNWRPVWNTGGKP